MIYIIETRVENDTLNPAVQTRAVDIIIGSGTTAYLLRVGRLPLEGDLQAILESREATLWSEVQRAGSQPINFRAWVLSRLNEWRGQMKKEIPLSDYLFSQLSYVAKSLAVKGNQPQRVKREARMRGLTQQQMLDLISQAEENWADKNDLVEAIYIGMLSRFSSSTTAIEELAQHFASLPASLTDCEAFYLAQWPE